MEAAAFNIYVVGGWPHISSMHFEDKYVAFLNIDLNKQKNVHIFDSYEI